MALVSDGRSARRAAGPGTQHSSTGAQPRMKFVRAWKKTGRSVALASFRNSTTALTTCPSHFNWQARQGGRGWADGRQGGGARHGASWPASQPGQAARQQVQAGSTAARQQCMHAGRRAQRTCGRSSMNPSLPVELLQHPLPSLVLCGGWWGRQGWWGRGRTAGLWRPADSPTPSPLRWQLTTQLHRSPMRRPSHLQH